MRKISMVILLLSTIIFAGCVGGGTTLNSGGRNIEKIIIGIDDEFPPICFHNERKELVGFDIDLAKETAKRLGVEVEFKPIEWDKKREEITSGNVDIIWNGLDITEERKEYMIFTRPYMDDRQIFLVKDTDKQSIRSEGDLAGKIVGMQAGSTSEDYLQRDDNLKESLGEYKTYRKFNDMLEALENDEVDVLICDELIARYENKNNPHHYELIDAKIDFVVEMAVGFRKEDVELRDRVQETFDEMVEDGTARKISEKWFQADLIKSVR
ncbi:MAG: amino acid ABC transporter substrate-binding protein [Selenomonadaceae bacterium]|nr:amino acid ABC transporter substrate-binding protein [Selenomonadaceae bacterium]